MASTPQLKIFNSEGGYIGCVKHYEDAACLVASYGKGASVRFGHDRKNVLWTEGAEDFSAGESYDRAATVMRQREDAIWAAGRAKQGARS
jgi:hypothetical protein